MPLLIIPAPLRSYVDDLTEVAVTGNTVAEAIKSLLAQYPSLKPHLTTQSGKLRPFVNLYLGEVHIRDLQGMETLLGNDDILRLIPAIAGGSGVKNNLSHIGHSKSLGCPNLFTYQIYFLA